VSRILAGPRAVTEALRSRRTVQAVFVQRGGRKALREVADAAAQAKVRVEEREGEELDALAEGHKHQGVVAIAGDYPYVDLDQIVAKAAAPALLVGLDQITDPYNFGAIVRSAVAFGADGVITMKKRAAPVTPVVVRASAGATEHLPIARVTNLSRSLEQLRERGMDAIGLDADGELAIDDLPPCDAGRVLVVGAEGKGLRRLVRERCTFLARIPQVGPVASLNASVAASVALYALASERRSRTAK